MGEAAGRLAQVGTHTARAVWIIVAFLSVAGCASRDSDAGRAALGNDDGGQGGRTSGGGSAGHAGSGAAPNAGGAGGRNEGTFECLGGGLLTCESGTVRLHTDNFDPATCSVVVLHCERGCAVDHLDGYPGTVPSDLCVPADAGVSFDGAGDPHDGAPPDAAHDAGADR